MSIHKRISYLKSFVRIIGYLMLVIHFNFGVATLIVSEVFGLMEEQWEK